MVTILISLLQFTLPMATPAFSNEGEFRRAGDYRQLSVDELLPRAASFDAAAVQELGRRRERSAIELLRTIAAESDVQYVRPHRTRISSEEMKKNFKEDRRNVAHTNAKIALARMGEGNYFDEFVVGLSSSNPMWRVECIGYLGKIGDKRAVKYLIPILDDDKSPGPNITSFSSNASGALGRILPDVYSQFAKDWADKPFYPEKVWKDWWAKNKDSFSDSK